MNGVHDLGGMHGMGPIEIERSEPVFHERWEGRIFALNRAVGAWARWNLDASRHSRELIPPAEYLRMSYYERFLAGLIELIVQHGLASRAEIESGLPAPGSLKPVPALMANGVATFVAAGAPASRDLPVRPRFRAGERVRARNIHPATHTRLPRYARGRIGAIERDHGVFVFPDTNAHLRGEKAQHVYSVCFAARELWGSRAPEKDRVYVDLWDDHLEPA
ncbi:MAG TPA: nitrile hydratase subunit beta [Steroidobacteraceae bacterium]|nr:nitrile hydratase subunit beta [Steroidobacteraceae bacterium]